MRQHKSKTKVFFFANLPIKGTPASYGGATVLAEEILDFLKNKEEIEIQQVPIRSNWKPKVHLIEHILWMIKFPFAIRKFDVVSFHTTWDFNFSTAPFVWLWAKLLGKKTIYHFFGGDFHKQYNKLPSFLKPIFNLTILNSDVVFFETKEMIQYFEDRKILKADWLPNARKPISEPIEERSFSKKFVFISRVIPEKGIREIIEASKTLPNDYTIDVYGPIDERSSNEFSFDGSNVNYKGVLQPTEVMAVLSQYDVLLLPSYFKGEGYPGIIIEALSLGIPSISTYWNSVPEIVEDQYNGKLIEIKNAEQLRQAILSFNEENYKKFSQNALNSFEQFNSEIVFNKILESYLDE